MKKPTKTYTGKYYRHKDDYRLIKVIGGETYEWGNFEDSSFEDKVFPIEVIAGEKGFDGYKYKKYLKLTELLEWFVLIDTVSERRMLPASSSLKETFILILTENCAVTNRGRRGWSTVSEQKNVTRAKKSRKKPVKVKYPPKIPQVTLSKKSKKFNLAEDSWEARVALVFDDTEV